LFKVGQYLDRLRTIGGFDDAAIFVIADHGTRGGFLEPSPGIIPEFIRSSAYPTIAYHAPGQAGPLKISQAPVALSDVYPTVLADFGLKSDNAQGGLGRAEGFGGREREFRFYKGITDIYGDYIPQSELFRISGDVRDPAAWHSGGVAVRDPQNLEMVDFGTPEASTVLNYGWSEEAKGQALSWLIANPATISGKISGQHRTRVTLRILNPHHNQRITFKVSDQVVGVIREPVPTGWVERQIEFDAQILPAGASALAVEAEVIGAQSERDLREVGVAFDWIKFEAID
jgi:hypothetical protein